MNLCMFSMPHLCIANVVTGIPALDHAGYQLGTFRHGFGGGTGGGGHGLRGGALLYREEK